MVVAAVVTTEFVTVAAEAATQMSVPLGAGKVAADYREGTGGSSPGTRWCGGGHSAGPPAQPCPCTRGGSQEVASDRMSGWWASMDFFTSRAALGLWKVPVKKKHCLLLSWGC